MISIRESVFETNSSACHCLTLIPKDQLIDFAKNRHKLCIYLPDTGDYQTGSDYKIMTIGEALHQYNEVHEKQNAHYKEMGWNMQDKTYEEFNEDGYDAFVKDLEKGFLNDDCGKYMCFAELMQHAIIENAMKFDVEWWNND